MYNLGSYSYVRPGGNDIEHIGPSFTQRHYIIYILKNKRWYKMNDSLVGCTSDDNKIQLLQVIPHGSYDIV